MNDVLPHGVPLSVPQEVIDQTTLCPSQFSCLSSGQCGDTQPCRVEAAHSENILFVKQEKPGFCPYKLSAGVDRICRCPVRYAIHERFGQALQK